jgi:hypothetical protein
MKRFWDKVDPEPTSGCWLWNAGCSAAGYGSLRVQKKSYSAHRFSAFLHGFDMSQQINHKCHNRVCVNPEHLYSGTQGENIQDAVRLGRMGFHSRKLTRKQVVEILDSKETGRSLARKFSVAEATVSRVRNRRMYLQEAPR